MTEKVRSSIEFIRSQKGISVFESLAAIALVVTVALASASFFQQQKTFLENSSTGASCRSVLEGQMSYLRMQGSMPQGLPWVDLPPSPTAASTPGGSAGYLRMHNHSGYDDPALDNTTRYNHLPRDVVRQNPSGNPGIVNPAGLLTGTMGTLNALYNYDTPRFCDNLDGVETTSSVFPAGSVFFPTYDAQPLREFKTYMRIQPIGLNSNAPSPCINNLWVRPQGVHSNLADQVRAIEGGPNSAMYGYRVTLKGTYKDSRDDVVTCEMSEDFRYPIDHGQHVVAEVFTRSNAKSWGTTPEGTRTDGNRNQCTHVLGSTEAEPPNLEVEIRIRPQPGAQFETGTTLLCADLSKQLNPYYCRTPSHPPAVNAGMEGEVYPPHPTDPMLAGTALDPTTAKWVPCSEVTACGIPPNHFQKLDPLLPVNENAIYKLYYSGTKSSRDGLWGCDIRIDVATVDTAGNIKTVSQPTSAPWTLPTNQRYFPPVDCWRCYKKKKRNWVGIVAAGALTYMTAGGYAVIGVAAGACASGSGGVCRAKGARFVGNFCSNSPPRRGYCRKATPERPAWIRDDDDPGACPRQTEYFPPPFEREKFNLPVTPPDGGYSETRLFPEAAAFCDIAAHCRPRPNLPGVWEGEAFEDDTISPMASCGKILTRYKMNVASAPIGSSAPAGVPECTMLLPTEAEATMPMMTRASYSAFQVCSGGTLCAPDPMNSLGPPIHPPDAMTMAPNNTDPNRYYYFEHTIPARNDLPECTP